MARKKHEPEVTYVAQLPWVRDDARSGSHPERWRVELPGISVFVSNYGAEDRRGGYFKGWRVVVGAPKQDEYPDRDAAMIAAREVIETEGRHRLAVIRQEIETGKLLVKLCEEAGIHLERKPDARRQTAMR